MANKRVLEVVALCLVLVMPVTHGMFGRAKQAIKTRPLAACLTGVGLACALPVGYELGNRMSRQEIKRIVKGEMPVAYIKDVWDRRLPFFKGGVSYDENYKLLGLAEKGDVDGVHDLLVRGALVNISEPEIDPVTNKYTKQRTPLMCAAASGNAKVVELLLSRNADVHVQDSKRNSVVAYAAGSGSLPIMKLLLRAGAQLQVKNKEGESPAAYAARSGFVDILKWFAENGVDLKQDNEAFLSASAFGCVSAVQLFLDAGIAVNDTFGSWGAIDCAAKEGHIETVKLLFKAGAKPCSNVLFRVDNIEVLNFLVDNGVPVDTRHEYGDATVFGKKACRSGFDINFLEALLAKGAQIDAQDKEGMSALMCFARDTNKGGITLARKHGASVALKDRAGHSALDYLETALQAELGLSHSHLQGALAVRALRDNPDLYPEKYKPLFSELFKQH